MSERDDGRNKFKRNLGIAAGTATAAVLLCAGASSVVQAGNGLGIVDVDLHLRREKEIGQQIECDTVLIDVSANSNFWGRPITRILGSYHDTSNGVQYDNSTWLQVGNSTYGSTQNAHFPKDPTTAVTVEVKAVVDVLGVTIPVARDSETIVAHCVPIQSGNSSG